MVTKAVDTPNNIYAALLQIQRDLKPVVKGSKAEVGKFSYKYVDLATVFETIMPTLHENNVVLLQPVEVLEGSGEVVVTTVLHHIPSETQVVSQYPIRAADMKDPQKVGGAVTYARRYAVLALIGAAPEDDDGQLARTPPPPTISQQFTKAIADKKITKTQWEEASTKLFGKPLATAELTDAQKRQYLDSIQKPAF